MDKMQMLWQTVKLAFAGFGAWISMKLGILGPILLALGIAMILDYTSGMMAAWKEGRDHPGDHTKGLSSKTGLQGIMKKLGYLMVIACAMMIDWLILTIAGQAGLAIPMTTFFGLLVTVWFILNEVLSIIENIGRIGVNLPEFLRKAVATLKGTVEKHGEQQAQLSTDEIKEE